LDKQKITDNLNILSIFHFVYGGITAIFSCIPIIHVVFGGALIFAPIPEAQDGPPMALLGGLFIGVGTLVIILGMAKAAALIYAGVCLRRYERRTFCMVVAAIACMGVPFGTLLGVFTIINLSKEEVGALFDKGDIEAS
jgi:hypothetical protein